MSVVLDVISWTCLLLGSFFALASSLALLRLPDFYSRVHGASVTDTMGAGLILIGLVFQAGISLISFKLVLVLVFMVLTGPTASHALAKAAYQLGLEPMLAEDGDGQGGEP